MFLLDKKMEELDKIKRKGNEKEEVKAGETV